MSSAPAEAIRLAIEDHGPIPFSEFMSLALYGPGGFYEHPPVGTRADFVTSPHVHPVFGAFLGRAIRRLAAGLGDPSPLSIVEFGAGDGTLARQILDELGEDLELTYAAVEVSRGAREALSAIDGVEVIDEDDRRAANLVLAHEVLDNLPFRRVREDREVRIGLVGGRLVEVEVPWEGEPGPPGVETIHPEGALTFVDRISERLDGYALIVDYGGVGSVGGEVHGYRGQGLVVDLLADPGSADITAGVDFATIAGRAEKRGLTAFGPATQREALLSLGFEAWTRLELKHQGELLNERRSLEAVRTWSGRSRAALLVDPAALGRLRWLVLASHGLPGPDFLS